MFLLSQNDFGHEWYRMQINKALSEMFSDIDGVIYMDVWQMTSCHYTHEAIHPATVIVGNEIDMLLSYVCPSWQRVQSECLIYIYHLKRSGDCDIKCLYMVRRAPNWHLHQCTLPRVLMPLNTCNPLWYLTFYLVCNLYITYSMYTCTFFWISFVFFTTPCDTLTHAIWYEYLMKNSYCK